MLRRAARSWQRALKPKTRRASYDVTPKGGESSIKLRMDGTVVMEPEWPEWVKKSMKKAGK